MNYKGYNREFIAKVLNILGLAVAFAAFYVILIQVYHDITYNRGVKESEKIFALSVPDWYTEGLYSSWMSRPIAEHILNTATDISSGGLLYLSPSSTLVSKEKAKNSAEFYSNAIEVMCTELSVGAIDVFGFEAVEGSFKDLVTNADVAVSRSCAKRIGIGVGSVLVAQNGGELRVVAVYKDMPVNSDLYNMEMFMNVGDKFLDNFREWSFPYFVKLKSAADKESFEKQANAIMEKDFSSGVADENKAEGEIKLFPFSDLYFSEVVKTSGKSGNKTTTYTLLFVAILTLFIAFVNYINFYLATIPVRIKGVNIRKILGSSRGALIRKILLESLYYVGISLVIAFVLLYLFAPSFVNSLISLSIAPQNNITIVVLTVVMALMLAIVSTIYPAMYMTSFQPALVIKGGFAHTGKGRGFRYFLVAMQFVISISLIICALFIRLQNDYMKEYDLGFDGENLLSVQVSQKIGAAAEVVGDKLKSNPQILDVAWSDGPIVSTGKMGWGREFKEEIISFYSYPVSYNFAKFLGLKIYQGRDFTKSDNNSENGLFIFNRKAQETFGFTLEDKVSGHREEKAEIVGFMENFNFKKLKYGVEPIALYLFGANPWRAPQRLYLRSAAGADLPQLFSFIKKTLVDYDGSLTEDMVYVRFFEAEINGLYGEESRFSRLVSIFTVIAILISLIGVFSLVMFETEYRRREIALRRINGASIKDILTMFNMQFVRIIALCVVIAVPFSWLVIERYLSTFTYRMEMKPWVFAISVLFVLLMTIVIVTLRCFKTATENPVNVLRSE